MFCGFLTIIYSSTDRFLHATTAIVIAILLDGLDGRVARKFNATSKFGVEFDSLSDLVSFGVAPAILIYNWCFQLKADEFGVFICFIYVICAASRLARFNISQEKMSAFQGLPSPAAAGLVASLVFAFSKVEHTNSLLIFSVLLMLSASYLMISSITFLSIKKVHLGMLDPKIIVGLAGIIWLFWYVPRFSFLALALAYALSGPLRLIYNKLKRS
ncbi:UNVERIFIED_CONTAM: hypothetical protein GTU68_058606 [Idotea baltica]|nr:hypothetical protein [Idotea baltica]